MLAVCKQTIVQLAGLGVCVCVCACARACVCLTRTSSFSESNIIVLDWVLTSVYVCVCVWKACSQDIWNLIYRPFTMYLYKVCHTPRSDGSPVCRGQFGEVLIFYDRPSTRSSNAPACRGQSRLSGFCCAHRLCVRSPCQHISRMRTFDENSCAISITSPKVDFRPRNPTCLVGTRGQVPASVHTMWLPKSR